MPKIHLTKRTIEMIRNPSSGQEFYWDKQLTGFGVKATKTGKSYIVEGQVNRKRRRFVIGKVEMFPPEIARKRAISVLAGMADGIDPNEEKRQQAISKITVKTAFDNYFELKPNLVASTVDGYKRTCDRYLSAWANVPIIEINKQMVLLKHQNIGAEFGKVTANNVFRHFRAVYNFTSAISDEFPPNPVLVLQQTRSWNKVRRRQTILPAHILPSWWQAVGHEGELTRDIMLVAIFTGMRKSEILSLRWENIDLQDRTLKIPTTKNGDPLTLPLSSFLFGLFKERRRLTGNSPWVFPANSASGHREDVKKMTARVSAAIVHPFCMHDLRRTYITIAESLDIPHYALKRLLNHRSYNDVTGGYIIINVDRLRDPVERVAEKILELVDEQ